MTSLHLFILSTFSFHLLLLRLPPLISFFFFFNDTATTEIYTLSLHDALPILPSATSSRPGSLTMSIGMGLLAFWRLNAGDRKSTRLNSSHQIISYAVFCLKKKKKMMLSLERIILIEPAMFAASGSRLLARLVY